MRLRALTILIVVLLVGGGCTEPGDDRLVHVPGDTLSVGVPPLEPGEPAYLGIFGVEARQAGLTVAEVTLRGVDAPVDIVVHAAAGPVVLVASEETVGDFRLQLEPVEGKALPRDASGSWYFLVELAGREPGTYEFEGLELRLADANGVVRPTFVPHAITFIVEEPA